MLRRRATKPAGMDRRPNRCRYSLTSPKYSDVAERSRRRHLSATDFFTQRDRREVVVVVDAVVSVVVADGNHSGHDHGCDHDLPRQSRGYGAASHLDFHCYLCYNLRT